MEKKIVVTLHGIMTRGKWQKELTPYLAKCDLIPYHLDYGFFGVWFFLLPFTREPKVAWLQQQIDAIIEKENCERISVVAHSFGTYLVAEVLRREPHQKRFDRIVLTGSIVSEDYGWAEHFAKRRVFAVRNEIATKDWVVSLCDFASRWLGWLLRLKAGRSGLDDGFKVQHEMLFQLQAITDHSGTHIVPNFVRWARFTAYPHLPEDWAAKIKGRLELLHVQAAKLLNVSSDLVRINICLPYKGKLHIVPECCINMLYAPELHLKLDIDGGSCTAMAFTDRRPRFVERTGRTWSDGALSAEDLANIAPNLKCVLSFPIQAPNSERRWGVVNIDSLDTTPAALRDPKDSAPLVELLWVSASKAVHSILDQASKGELIEN